MTCLIAILLSSVARMVVIGSRNSPNYYGVYTISKINEFPVPRDSHKIHMSASKISGPGTYVVAYCSINLEYLEIMEIITRGRPEVTHSSGDVSSSHLRAENVCMQSIIKENSLGPVAASLSKLDNGKCTHQLIASLAFKGVIGVEGEYSCFAPPQEDQPIKINADIPIVMHEFLSGGVFLGGENIESDRQALVWFQGNLHRFMKSKIGINGYHSWSPVTLIGKEINNGDSIAEFIYYSLPSIREFICEIEDYGILLELLEMSYLPWQWKLSRSNLEQGGYSKISEILDNKCMQASGFEEKYCGWLINVPGYLMKNARDIGLLCRTRAIGWTGLNRMRECIFRPAIAQRSLFSSRQWEIYGPEQKAFEIPSQSNRSENAARFTELTVIGTLCENDSW
ncbi:Bgt-51915 [Blumeria graminis f. sp. tritici]|uniref:Bgt-51915 n=1 Tax=Blumeria graminis f. sp. tritici TaxID=62690 RepID=A0A9X9QCI1_BLUGR|nr:Bgt-51915 [Blumeria graminis f. sp. tritici]